MAGDGWRSAVQCRSKERRTGVSIDLTNASSPVEGDCRDTGRKSGQLAWGARERGVRVDKVPRNAMESLEGDLQIEKRGGTGGCWIQLTATAGAAWSRLMRAQWTVRSFSCDIHDTVRNATRSMHCTVRNLIWCSNTVEEISSAISEWTYEMPLWLSHHLGKKLGMIWRQLCLRL